MVMESSEVTIGVDPHKGSNTISVLDTTGAVVLQARFPNTHRGFNEMRKAVAVYPTRRWAVEGANGMGRSVAQRLVAEGENVADVPAKLAARVRVYSEGHGRKTDAADATSVAKAAVHSPRIRPVVIDDETVALKLVVDRRHELVAARTASMCRLHRLLRELIPGGAPRELSVDRAQQMLDKLDVSGPAAVMRRDLGFEHVEDVRVIDRRIDEVNTRIIAMTKQRDTTLIRIYGIGWIAAAVVIAETVDVRRFPSKHHFASYTGTAPIDVSSGDNHKHRLSRSGNRRLNWAIHVAAITQIRNQTPGREFYDRKIAEGKTKKEALRALKRRISDAVWKQLQLDLEPAPSEQDLVWPRWPSSRGTYRHYKSFDTPRANGKPGRRKARSVADGPGVWPQPRVSNEANN
jgi:transposase